MGGHRLVAALVHVCLAVEAVAAAAGAVGDLQGLAVSIEFSESLSLNSHDIIMARSIPFETPPPVAIAHQSPLFSTGSNGGAGYVNGYTAESGMSCLRSSTAR